MSNRRRTPYYWHKQSVHTPTFIDLDKYIPKPEERNTPTFIDLDKYLPKPEESNLSPFNRQYPKPITPTSLNKLSNDTQSKIKKSSSSTSTTTTSTTARTTSADPGTLRVNVTREQHRTISLSSGETFYSTSGQGTDRRPAKRRHHSAATPGFQDEIDAKRAKRNYPAPQARNSARSLSFQPFDVEPPVFTLETVSTGIFAKLCVTNLHLQ